MLILEGQTCSLGRAFTTRFCDQKHHMASHLIRRAWWRGSDPFPESYATLLIAHVVY
jgi:hypothetical protein